MHSYAGTDINRAGPCKSEIWSKGADVLETAGHISRAAAAEETKAVTNSRAGAGHIGIDETNRELLGTASIGAIGGYTSRSAQRKQCSATRHGTTPWQDTATPPRCQIQ